MFLPKCIWDIKISFPYIRQWLLPKHELFLQVQGVLDWLQQSPKWGSASIVSRSIAAPTPRSSSGSPQILGLFEPFEHWFHMSCKSCGQLGATEGGILTKRSCFTMLKRLWKVRTRLLFWLFKVDGRAGLTSLRDQTFWEIKSYVQE